MDTPIVTSFKIGDDITARPFRVGDAQSVFVAVNANYEHLREYMHWVVPDYSIRHAEEFIERSIESAATMTSLGFGLFTPSEMIGSIGFVNFDGKARRTEIGYWIAKSHEGRGIISECCRLLINYAFDVLNMNRIEIRCATENVRSAAIPERFGFVREGILRQSELRNGRLHDFAVYGLLASEWKR